MDGDIDSVKPLMLSFLSRNILGMDEMVLLKLAAISTIPQILKLRC